MAERVTPERLSAAATSGRLRTFEVDSGEDPARHEGSGALGAADPFIDSQEQLLTTDSDLDGLIREACVPQAMSQGHGCAADDGAVVAGDDRLGSGKQIVVRKVPRVLRS